MGERARSLGRPLSGILILDKPSGATSNRVLQRAKRLFQAAKAGHTGSLDPMATGMLPICFGNATKVSGLMLESSKTYSVTAKFGTATNTGDADGEIIAERDSAPVDHGKLAAALESMLGDIQQVPPMFSALKINGRRLYELARQGKEVPREARQVTIHALHLDQIAWPEIQFTVHCSKGTYVRTLVTDLAANLGTVAHVIALRRLNVAPYEEQQMLSFEALEAAAERGLAALDHHLLSVDSALVEMPPVTLDSSLAQALTHGQKVPAGASAALGTVRVYGPSGVFVGIGEVLGSGELKPRRIFASEALGPG